MTDIREQQIERLKNFTKSPTITKSSINFDLESLRMIASYILSYNSMINRQSLNNILFLFNSINLNIFNNDPEKLKYIDIIIKGAESRITSGSENPEVILAMIRGGIISNNSNNDEYTEIFKTIYPLNSDEIKFVNNTIESCIDYLNISNYMPKIIDLCTDIEQNKTQSKVHELIDKFNDLISDYISSVRNNRSNMGNDVPFRLSSKNRELFIDDFIIKSEKMSDKILTGIQELNKIIGGGFERERCYVLTGGAGIGKSLVCLNLILQFIEFNKELKTLDPSKKPCFVYITQENSIFETTQRLLSILGCKNPTRTSRNEINELLGLITENQDEPDFEIIIDYFEPGVYTTDILYQYYDNLYQEGFEIVVLIQDHIKKILSSKYRGKVDLRLELGEVVNEFKKFAVLKKCSVITVSHLNRVADTKINDAINRGVDDPLKELSRDVIGESYLIIDNADLCLFMHKMIDYNNESVICFNRIKERMQCDPFRKYMVHPLDGARLITDLYSTSLSRMSINPDSVANKLNVNFDKNNNIHNTIGKYSSELGRPIQESDIVKPNSGVKLVTMDDIFAGKDVEISTIKITTPQTNNDKIPFLNFKQI